MRRAIPFLALVAIACSQGARGSSSGSPPASSVSTAAATDARSGEDDEARPTEPFTDGQRAFLGAKDALLHGYYRDTISEDDLYRAALEGMLEHVDPQMKRWNKLLSPSELGEIQSELKGELVGVGVQIDFHPDTGHIVVLGTVPGSPAERAGMIAADEILSIDGKLYKGRTLHDVVGDIRGKAGVTLTLSVLRDDRVLSMTVARAAIGYAPAVSMTLPGAVGYLRLRSFSAKTPTAARAALDDLVKAGSRALVVDLRGNPGGSFDDAVATAGLLLPPGTVVVQTEGRGHKVEKFASQGPGLLPIAPVAVLIDPGTSSGAEFIAATLQEQRHATLVGGHTFGKWSVQRLDDLPNGYAIKYTSQLFRSPAGRSFEGTGLPPDVDVSMDARDIEKAQSITQDAAKRLSADVQLRTAVALLRSP
jgi:carboxyl-terminal processing protease